jgi:pimeloyl-ACP methyl ester carboxylesterase
MFHSSVWLERVAQTSGSKVVAVDAGHWLTVSAPDAVNRELDRFLPGHDVT